MMGEPVGQQDGRLPTLRHKAALLRELPGTQDPRDITEKSLSRILKSQILPPRFHRFAPETVPFGGVAQLALGIAPAGT